MSTLKQATTFSNAFLKLKSLFDHHAKITCVSKDTYGFHTQTLFSVEEPQGETAHIAFNTEPNTEKPQSISISTAESEAPQHFSEETATTSALFKYLLETTGDSDLQQSITALANELHITLA